MTAITNLADVKAARSALFAREAAGETVTDDEWTALGDAQISLTAHMWGPSGYAR